MKKGGVHGVGVLFEMCDFEVFWFSMFANFMCLFDDWSAAELGSCLTLYVKCSMVFISLAASCVVFPLVFLPFSTVFYQLRT